MQNTDNELFRRIQNKDDKALEQLYERYEKLLFSFSYRMTSNKFLAEEAVQDVFTKLWTKKAHYDDGKGKFSSWILTVTRHACIDLIRKQKEVPYEFEERDSLHAQDPTPEESIVWNECSEVIRECVQQLKQEQQEIIELFYFKSMSQSSIAESCNLPLGTVKGRVRLALKHLNQILSSRKEGGVHDDV